MRNPESFLSERDKRLSRAEEYYQECMTTALANFEEKKRNIEAKRKLMIESAHKDYESHMAMYKNHKEKKPKAKKLDWRNMISTELEAECRKQAYESIGLSRDTKLSSLTKEQLEQVKAFTKKRFAYYSTRKDPYWELVAKDAGIDADTENPDDIAFIKLGIRFQYLTKDELWPMREDLNYVWDATCFKDYYDECKPMYEKYKKEREKKSLPCKTFLEYLESDLQDVEQAFTDHKQKEQGKGDYKNVDTMNGLTDLLDEDEQLAELEQYEQNVKELEQELESASVVSSLTQVSAPPANDPHPAEVSETIQKVEPPKETVSVEQPKPKMPTVINLSALKKPEPVQEQQDRPKIISNTKQKKPLVKGSAFAQFFHQ